MTKKLWVTRAVACTFAFASSALMLGQTPSDCSPITLVSVPELTFKQRACFYGERLISPTLALRAGFMAAFGQVRNSPHMTEHDFAEFPHRLEVYYASRVGRDAGELLAGYLHHEDPRYHSSNAKGFWRRTSSALLSVMVSPDMDDGHWRMAYSPIAGSLSAAFVDSAMYRHSETVPTALTHAGFIYSRYFLKAVYMEFRPEVSSYTHHLLHRDKN